MDAAAAVQDGFSIFKSLRKVHLPSLWNPADKAYSYALTSIYYAAAEVTLPGDYAEFGVFQGRCARFLENLMGKDRKLHLFDSLEGLPENWIPGKWDKGHFALAEDKIPQFSPGRCPVYRGWFKDTLPGFVEQHKEPLALIHLDADLYSSTMDVFNNINHLIVPGTILLFDEYVFKGTDDEHRAVIDWSYARGREYELLWRTGKCQACARVLK